MRIDLLPAELREKVNQRLAICNACEHYNKDTSRCGVCGCFMKVKAMLPGVSCPKKKW